MVEAAAADEPDVDDAENAATMTTMRWNRSVESYNRKQQKMELHHSRVAIPERPRDERPWGTRRCINWTTGGGACRTSR